MFALRWNRTRNKSYFDPTPDPTQVVHMLKYQAPVLALALAPDNSSLIAATTDRTLTIRRRDLRHAAALAERERGVAAKGGARVGGIGGIGGIGADGVVGGGGPRPVRTGTARYFNRGKTESAGEGDVKVGASICCCCCCCCWPLWRTASGEEDISTTYPSTLEGPGTETNKVCSPLSGVFGYSTLNRTTPVLQ